MTIPLTGQQFQISAGPSLATVTELGAGLRELLFRGQPVILGYEADELPPAGAGQLLVPWPNRIDGGRYAFGGADFGAGFWDLATGGGRRGRAARRRSKDPRDEPLERRLPAPAVAPLQRAALGARLTQGCDHRAARRRRGDGTHRPPSDP